MKKTSGVPQGFPVYPESLEAVTKEYKCIRPLTSHYFTFTWVKDDEHSEVRWECPECGLPQTLRKDEPR